MKDTQATAAGPEPGEGGFPNYPECPENLLALLLPGDIIFHRTEGSFLGTLITEYTQSPYSHCEIFVSGDQCISADFPHIHLHNKMLKLWVDVFRWKAPLTPQQQQEVIDAACAHEGEWYDWKALLLFPWAYFIPVLAKYLAANRAFMCSELVDLSYYMAGLDIRADISLPLVSPGDLSRSPKLEFMGSYYHGIRRETTPNVRDPRQPAPNKAAQWLIRKITATWTREDVLSKQANMRQKMEKHREK